MSARTFILNGNQTIIDPGKQHLSAAEYIRQFAHCKSVKVGCNEGGCGACAVEVVQQNAATGEECVLAVNSCLLPVGALSGMSVITAEGLGNSRQGLHQVQERLAGFHGTQCGFCSPGIAISCHAALAAAAAKPHAASVPDSNVQRCPDHTMNGAAPGTAACNQNREHGLSAAVDGCNGDGSDSSNGFAAGPAAAELLSALDGNLCRCTGWRPIADMVKSFACDVDIEDLGLHSLKPDQLGPINQQQLTPACRKQQPQQQQTQQHMSDDQQQDQQQQQFDTALLHLHPGSFLVPRTLQQLLAAMQAAAAAGVPVHLLAGNTGAGIYKQQWQELPKSVCIVMKHVEELQQLSVVGCAMSHKASPNQLECNKQAPAAAPHILAGAGVTISQIIRVLKDLAAAQSAAGQQQYAQNLSFLLAHLSRIAGTLVRNAATLGGHLVLARSQGLESDLLPFMIAAGAELQLTDMQNNSIWMSVEDYMAAGSSTGSISNSSGGTDHQHVDTDTARLISQLRTSALITAVRLPLPLGAASASSSRDADASSSSVDACTLPRVWSHKLSTHRHANEHAVINMCCWLDSQTAAAAEGAAGGQQYSLRIAVGTYQAVQGVKTCNSSSNSDEGVWVCSRATDVEAEMLEALQQQQQGVGSAAAALCGVLSRLPELLLQDIHPAGRMADYVRSVGPALLLKGLATVLPLQDLDHQQTAPGTAAAEAAATLTKTGATPGRFAVTPALLAELRSSALSALSSDSIVARGRQDLPVDMTAAPPLYWPTPKDGGELQVTGEAEYTDDAPITAGALYAAYVTSSQLYARLIGIDWTPAMQVQGVVGYVSPEDIPAGPDCDFTAAKYTVLPNEPLFAHDTVQYVGQPLGLVVAGTLSAARAGAAKVLVQYGPVGSSSHDSSSSSNGNGAAGEPQAKSVADKPRTADGDTAVGVVSGISISSSSCNAGAATSECVGNRAGVVSSGAITTLSAAIAANSWYDLAKFPSAQARKGDVSAALSSSARVLKGQLKLGSQRHFYLEPQTAVATPEEGGRMTVISSCQGTDQVLHPVARLLKVRHNQVHVTANRVGGGFGGKADRASYPAGAAAVAAHKFRRQVRLVVDGCVDASMNAGRCPMLVDWTAGLDHQGQLQALQIDITLVAGAFFGTTTVEVVTMPPTMDSVYHIPAYQVTLRAARCNLPPRTTVRGPGKVSAAILIEQVLQQIATAVGQDPERFRESLMIPVPQQVLAAAHTAAAAEDSGGLSANDTNGGGSGSRMTANGTADGHCKQRQQQYINAAQADNGRKQVSTTSSSGTVLLDIPHPKYYPRAPEAKKALQQQQQQESLTVYTTFGKPVPVHTYTLPYMWQHLKAVSQYDDRKAAVEEFNRQHKLKKRGLALVPVRFECNHAQKVATVTLYADGSVLLMHAGTEMGQGIATKVKQTAAASLGELLPAGQAAVLLDYIRVATASTELMPHAGLAAASTTSEAATAGVAAACDILVERLRTAADKVAAAGPAVDADKVGGAELWEKIVREVAELSPVLCSRELMTASALAGFSDSDPWMVYHTFGVAAAEVEIDCCTGERKLLRADLMFDAGRTVNPAIDLGQIEGAFMMGVGYVLHEEVLEDEATGKTVSNTTWEYKPPGIHELPKEFNVHMLQESPVHVPTRKQLSAKATGEPPMMMSAAVACALQDAIAAAWIDYKMQQQVQGLSVLTDSTSAVLHGTDNERMQQPVSQPVLELPATTANIKRALPQLL